MRITRSGSVGLPGSSCCEPHETDENVRAGVSNGEASIANYTLITMLALYNYFYTYLIFTRCVDERWCFLWREDYKTYATTSTYICMYIKVIGAVLSIFTTFVSFSFIFVNEHVHHGYVIKMYRLIIYVSTRWFLTYTYGRDTYVPCS